MKIRCATNSVRLRLWKSDLEILRQSGVLSDKVSFPSGDFVFGLALSTENNPRINFSDGKLEVSVPAEDANQWMDSDQVGLKYEIENSPLNFTEILIEKDFPCKDRDEDHSDTFFELDPSNEAC
jgi:hypothetical protein